MEKGKTKYQGNYEEISRAGFDVESIMQSFNESLTAKKGEDKKSYKAEAKQDKTETTINDVDKKEAGDKKKGDGDEEETDQEKETQHGIDEDDGKKVIDLIKPENTNFGEIRFRDYIRLFSFARGGKCSIFVYFLLAAIAMGNQLMVSLFISYWTDLDLEEQ